MARNVEIQSPLSPSLEARLKMMKIEDKIEVTVSLYAPFDRSYERLNLYLQVKGVAKYVPLSSFGLVVDLHLTRRDVLDLAEQEYVREMGLVLEEYK
jgi:hypothetical protein